MSGVLTGLQYVSDGQAVKVIDSQSIGDNHILSIVSASEDSRLALFAHNQSSDPIQVESRKNMRGAPYRMDLKGGEFKVADHDAVVIRVDGPRAWALIELTVYTRSFPQRVREYLAENLPGNLSSHPRQVLSQHTMYVFGSDYGL